MSIKKEYYSIAEVAEMLGFSQDTIRRAIDKSEIKAIKILNRWRIPTEEVQRLTTEVEK